MSNARPQYPRECLTAWLRSLGDAQDGKESQEPLAELIDVVFFASLEKEEGTPIRVRVVYHEQGIEGLRDVNEARLVGGAQGTTPAWQILPFEHASGVTDLTVKALAKIASAANLPRTAVVVGPSQGKLEIQGVARRVERTYFNAQGEERSVILFAPRPGHVVLLFRGEAVFRYENGGAVEVPRRPSLFDVLNNKDSAIHAALQSLCSKILNEAPSPSPFEADRYGLVSQAVAGLVERMAAGDHGGLVALLPAPHDVEKEASAGKYRFSAAYRHILSTRLADVAKSHAYNWKLAWSDTKSETPKTAEEEFEDEVAQDDEKIARRDFEALLQNIGQFSTIDNALLIGPELELLCAGYPISVGKRRPIVYEAATLDGARGARFPLLRHGSRHRAAATFAKRFPGALAFLCSQDGDLRCFHRLPGKEHVLLWNLSHSEW